MSTALLFCPLLAITLNFKHHKTLMKPPSKTLMILGFAGLNSAIILAATYFSANYRPTSVREHLIIVLGTITACILAPIISLYLPFKPSKTEDNFTDTTPLALCLSAAVRFACRDQWELVGWALVVAFATAITMRVLRFAISRALVYFPRAK